MFMSNYRPYPSWYPYVPTYSTSYGYPSTPFICTMPPAYSMMDWNLYHIQQKDNPIRLYGQEDDPNGQHPIGFPSTLYDVSRHIQELAQLIPHDFPRNDPSQWPVISVWATTRELEQFRRYFDLTQMKPLEIDTALLKIQAGEFAAIEKIAYYLDIAILKKAFYIFSK